MYMATQRYIIVLHKASVHVRKTQNQFESWHNYKFFFLIQKL